MIVTRRDFDAGIWREFFAEKRDVERLEITAYELDVYFEFSDEPWSIREFREESSMRLWLENLWAAMPEVCIAHKRFVPCRVAEGCEFSIEPADIATVREYQHG